MSILTVRVRPLADGWLVEAEGLAAPMIFAGGARAEKAAQRLAVAWAGTAGALLDVELRGGPGYTYLCLPVHRPAGPRFVAAPMEPRDPGETPVRATAGSGGGP